MKRYAHNTFYTYKAFWLDQYEGELLIQFLPEDKIDLINEDNTLLVKSYNWVNVKKKYPDLYDLIFECLTIIFHNQPGFTNFYQLVELDNVVYINPYFLDTKEDE